MTETERRVFVEMVEKQAARCRKPHFSSGSYPDRQRIEDWNNGVASLSRELLKVIEKMSVTPDGG